MQNKSEKITKKKRIFFSESFDITNWENVKPELDKLSEESIQSETELLTFLEKVGELSDILHEEEAWRYIRMTQFASEKQYSKAFNEFQAEVVSKTKPYFFQYNRKFYDSPFRKYLQEHAHLIQCIANEIELFHEANVPLEVQESELANQYGAIYSGLTVPFQGEEKTLSQLSVFLEEQNRTIREEAWRLRAEKMAEVKEKLNSLFDEMKTIRIKQSENVGFSNYRDYIHAKKGRFSYTPQDLYDFHDAVEKEVLPFLKKLSKERKEKLQLSTLRPWDTSVDLDGKRLEPFVNVEELTEKSIDILQKVKPEFGENLAKMKVSSLLDLDNRKGKAPGGYNYPLQETGAPFIFMNAVGIHRNVVTLMHEAGHAMHTFATSDIKIDVYKDTPSEIAELASMTMEFLTMDDWNLFYAHPDDLKKAKKEQLVGALKFLPWCMTVDAFQHWIYTNPNHTVAERDEFFASLMDRFNAGVDWSDLDEYKTNSWLFQLHIFETPFYYIEYAMSQLGALAMYKNYKTSGKEKTLAQYEDFLKLGYKVPVKELYETAGIKFDFSAEYLRQIVAFVQEEVEKL